MAKTQNKPTRREKSQIKGRMTSFLMFLPNMFTLLGRLIKDSRVPLAEKALFAAAIVYVIMPLDFIPDFFPFIGQVDDVYLVALTLLRLINKTDASIVREHWSGGGDIVSLADSIAGIAPMLLPKRVTRVLSSKVELAPDAGKALLSITDKNKKQPIVVETPQLHDDELIEIDSNHR
ncbi:MAG TPA: YkvA family protein [Pyrinomonadaceae bacterium]|jgi:uncharacterized membrane protein YkvA (DUF1232 family)